MAAKSKRKGKAGEREACKILGEYLGGNWERVFSSGAFVGGKNNVRSSRMSEGQLKAHKADIIPPDEFDIVIEVKNYADFPFHKLGSDIIPLLEDWLDEIYSCITDNEFWLLIMKFDRKGWYVLFDYNVANNFNVNTYSKYYSPKHDKSFLFTGSLQKFLEGNKDAITALINKNLANGM
jgi:hypothetical protein